MSGTRSSGDWSPLLVLGLAAAGIVVGVSVPALRPLTVGLVLVIILALLLRYTTTIQQQVRSL